MASATSPIVTATLQSAGLNAISNIVGQLLSCWQAQTPFSISFVAFARFVLISTLLCPPNFIWQSFLEAQFPGYAKELTPSEKEKLVDEVVTGSSSSTEKNAASSARSRAKREDDAAAKIEKATPKGKGSLDVTNTAIKFTLDQTIGTAINIAAFIIGMALMRGDSWTAVIDEVRRDFLAIILAGQKFWPIVSLLSFTLVPVERRTLFGSIAGLFWGIYLSIVSNKK